jgi:nitric oxide reductase NorQ protein
LAARLREVEPLGLAEMPSTRLLVSAARLIQAGVPPRTACNAAVVEALTDDVEVADGLRDLVALVF